MNTVTINSTSDVITKDKDGNIIHVEWNMDITGPQ